MSEWHKSETINKKSVAKSSQSTGQLTGQQQNIPNLFHFEK